MRFALIQLPRYALHFARQAAPGGDVLAALRTIAPPSSGAGHSLNLWFFGRLFPLILCIGYLPGWLIEQDLVLRIQAARSTRHAYIGAVLGLVLVSLFVLILPNLIAFCSLVVFPPSGGTAATAVGNEAGEQAYRIISAFIEKMPLGLSPFMMMGILACQMSTVDTFSNVTAMALAYDLVLPRFKGRESARTRLLVSRRISFAVITLCLVCALYSSSLNDVYFI